jgi:hypothetical protein
LYTSTIDDEHPQPAERALTVASTGPRCGQLAQWFSASRVGLRRHFATTRLPIGIHAVIRPHSSQM